MSLLITLKYFVLIIRQMQLSDFSYNTMLGGHNKLKNNVVVGLCAKGRTSPTGSFGLV